MVGRGISGSGRTGGIVIRDMSLFHGRAFAVIAAAISSAAVVVLNPEPIATVSAVLIIFFCLGTHSLTARARLGCLGLLFGAVSWSQATEPHNDALWLAYATAVFA